MYKNLLYKQSTCAYNRQNYLYQITLNVQRYISCRSPAFHCTTSNLILSTWPYMYVHNLPLMKPFLVHKVRFLQVVLLFVTNLMSRLTFGNNTIISKFHIKKVNQVLPMHKIIMKDEVHERIWETHVLNILLSIFRKHELSETRSIFVFNRSIFRQARIKERISTSYMSHVHFCSSTCDKVVYDICTCVNDLAEAVRPPSDL